MKLNIYQVDAFTDNIFSGNPAAVCPLEEWLTDDIMQKIAAENNLSETAFYVKKDTEYEIRWFTPTVEVDLCGHATIAAAFVIFQFENTQEETLYFNSPRSGILNVSKKEELLTLNFPADTIQPVDLSHEMKACFSIQPQAAFKGKTDYLFIFENEEEIQTLIPDFGLIAKLNARGVIVTAEGSNVDFVSRFFCPQSGINEDPVTGSAHTTLTPYWSQVLNKMELSAVQLSARKGSLLCKNLNERVEISGKSKLYLIGEIFLS